MKQKVIKKQGITVAMAATMVVIIFLLTTTITISVVHTVKSSKLRGFATELNLVQTTVTDVLYSSTLDEYLLDDVTLNITNMEQFEGENVTNNSLLLHILDLHKLGIKKSAYGLGKEDNDFYAVSDTTGKVYYLAGYDAGDKIYYTLTGDLNTMLSGINVTDDGTNTNHIIFIPNNAGWIREPIQVRIRVPHAIDIGTVTITTNVGEITNSGIVTGSAYNEVVVNQNGFAGNYEITVNYSLKGVRKTQVYSVTNYDNEIPNLTVGETVEEEKTVYINNVVATDNGKIKVFKYTNFKLTTDEAKNYFKQSGVKIKGNRIKFSKTDEKYTIYVEDFAGNILVKTGSVK